MPGTLISLSPTAAGEARPAPRRRGVELAMLAFAVVLVITADVVVDATFNDTVSSAVWTYGAGFALIYGVAHVAVRWLAPYADPLILPAVALLNGLGLVLIRRRNGAGQLGSRIIFRDSRIELGAAPLDATYTEI